MVLIFHVQSCVKRGEALIIQSILLIFIRDDKYSSSCFRRLVSMATSYPPPPHPAPNKHTQLCHCTSIRHRCTLCYSSTCHTNPPGLSHKMSLNRSACIVHTSQIHLKTGTTYMCILRMDPNHLEFCIQYMCFWGLDLYLIWVPDTVIWILISSSVTVYIAIPANYTKWQCGMDDGKMPDPDGWFCWMQKITVVNL